MNFMVGWVRSKFLTSYKMNNYSMNTFYMKLKKYFPFDRKFKKLKRTTLKNM